MSLALAERFPHMASGKAVFLAGVIEGAQPPKLRPVPQWAQEVRMVGAESGSVYARGKDVKWTNDRAPHLVEVMECLSMADPSTEVTFTGSAQIAKTEAGLNLVGQIIDEDPSPILILLPSLSEQQKYVQIKLQTTIDATAVLREKVRANKSRDADSSTQTTKRFKGGYAVIATASSSKALQMVSYRIVIGEEISEWPVDVGGRGDPLDQALARTVTYQDTIGAKCYWVATPGIKGRCRVTAKYEAGDQRRRYVECPHCGALQRLEMENMRARRSTAPYGAYFICASGNGCVIEATDKDSILRRGVWLKTYPSSPTGDDPANDNGEDIGAPGIVVLPAQLSAYRGRSSCGRQPSFHIWQAYALNVSWDSVWGRRLKAEKGDDREKKAYSQQVLGVAWEEKGDAPDAEKLAALVEDYPLRTLPPGALFSTLFCDVQGYGLKWDAYGWGRDFECWHVDGGTIEGDPTQDAVWAELANVVRRPLMDSFGQHWPLDAAGVDTGYISHRVYRFVRDQKRAGFDKMFATDGRGGEKNSVMPPLGKPKKVKITFQGKTMGSTLLWPVGTWGQKLELYGALNRRLRAAKSPLDPQGQPWKGLPHFGTYCDLSFFQELTAESLITHENGDREWKKHRTNDRLDCFVGARALAAHLVDEMSMNEDKWDALAAARRPREVQGDLLSLPVRIKVAASPSVPPPGADQPPPSSSAPPAAVSQPTRRRTSRSSSFMNRGA
ncbi:phage terminase large subunit family protein [Nitrospirillum iridis]|uniref:Phage terminase large subunit GpA-like protein n=1 Tax=Nitrospirillum iridis TaxID=765888 RepID=A0A7X0AWJ3_9PROT|nr:terminase gpA endonuclease subunit [Nitrospirillum iridis]MBB6251419.1 phage terminase large subunit GpA-like protein [Nitrospirillum iridis]